MRETMCRPGEHKSGSGHRKCGECALQGVYSYLSGENANILIYNVNTEDMIATSPCNVMPLLLYDTILALAVEVLFWDLIVNFTLPYFNDSTLSMTF